MLLLARLEAGGVVLCWCTSSDGWCCVSPPRASSAVSAALSGRLPTPVSRTAGRGALRGERGALSFSARISHLCHACTGQRGGRVRAINITHQHHKFIIFETSVTALQAAAFNAGGWRQTRATTGEGPT